MAAALGTVAGPRAVAHEAGKQAVKTDEASGILNNNPQMQYRPMGRTGVKVSALGFGMLRLPMKTDTWISTRLRLWYTVPSRAE